MRCVAGVGLLLLVSCNQILGLTPARLSDAADATVDMPHVAFTWQLATSQMSGAPEPALGTPPFDPAFARQMQIRIATLGGPFVDADYLVTPGMEGWIPVPRAYFQDTWRLEYTLGGVPHEVQWKPADKIGHLTVPMVGPVDRAPVPGGSGYQITPTNYSGGYTNPRVLTTGLWTDGLVTAPVVGGATVDYDFSNAISLSGPKGRPDTVPGARAMLVDFATDNPPAPASPCIRIASGSASVDPALQAGVHAVQSGTWDRNTRPVDAPAIDKADLERVSINDPLRGTFSLLDSVVLYGAVASTTFPGLVGVPPEFTRVKLPIPAMQILVQCRYDRSPLPSAASPAALDDFPRILHVQLVAIRQALGVELDGGLETVIASSAAGGFKIAFPAPLAKTMTLTTSTGAMTSAIDLGGPVDQIPIGRPDSLTLSFTSESGSDLRPDYHDVILHKIAGGALTTERIFTVTAPQVRIDGSLLAPSTDYVLEIRTYKGHLMASSGDFAPVDYPYGAAIVFTRTFRTS